MTWILTLLLLHPNAAPEIWTLEIPSQADCRSLGIQWRSKPRDSQDIAYFHCDKH